MAPLPVTRRHRASQLLGKLPRSPKQPSDVGAGPPTAQDPNQLPAVANYANDEEALIGELVGQRVLKGRRVLLLLQAALGHTRWKEAEVERLQDNGCDGTRNRDLGW